MSPAAESVREQARSYEKHLGAAGKTVAPTSIAVQRIGPHQRLGWALAALYRKVIPAESALHHVLQILGIFPQNVKAIALSIFAEHDR
ncbi:hypothetical protein QA447_25545 [Pseudomonas sp. abacavir_1]